MNQRILNEVIKEVKFDYKTDILYKLLQDVDNPGYYTNRAVQLLREAQYLGIDSRVNEAIKVLLIWKCVTKAAGQKKKVNRPKKKPVGLSQKIGLEERKP